MSEENKETGGVLKKIFWKITSERRFTIKELIKRRNQPVVTDALEGTPYPALKPLDDGTWELLEDWNCAYEDHKYTVPKGFNTDGASIPRFLWPIYGSPMEYPYPLSATLHDYLYYSGCVEDPDPKCDLRKQADKAFRDYNMQLGMGKIKAYTEYWALRLFGGGSWNQD